MKKILLLAGILAASLVTGCGGSNVVKTTEMPQLDTNLYVGMVTDSGSIDDRSFNQGTWEGVSSAVRNAKYIQPSGTTTADYVTAISNLYDGGYRFIVTPGYTFEGAVYEAQQKYQDANFLLIDGLPTSANGDSFIGENTTCVSFAEQEASFLAGVAAAVELKEGNFAFLGGVEVPAVQKLNWGFQQGIAYANEHLDTNIKIQKEHVIYQGSFTDMAAGQQIASQLYDKGVKVIMTAAGGTGVGAVTEAKARALKGEDVWTIGVDVDQYNEGIYKEGQSVMLTSAMKYLDRAAYNTIKDFTEGAFNGGQSLVFTAANDGVGIPSENPNLSDETMAIVETVKAKIKSGEIVVADNNDLGNLIK